MHTLDQILTKKDYSRKTPASLFYKDSPLWQKLLTIGCVVPVGQPLHSILPPCWYVL